MPRLATAAPVAREAETLAIANWRANVAALAETQAGLAARLEGQSIRMAWRFGRDGALTAHDAAGRWWAGCSVPSAAAEAMLRTFACSGTVACFLRPPTAAALRIALDKLRRNQSIVAIVPDLEAARVTLHCASFAEDIRAHRLWLVTGGDDDWETQLADLLRDNEGLPMPSQFIRLTDGSEECAEAMIAPAQRVFGEIAQQRAAAVAEIQAKPGASRRGIGLVAPTHFRLWDDAGYALATVAAGLGCARLDPDDPACASPLALARTAARCDTVIMPNVARADLPNVVASSTRWITWLTAPRIPSATAAGPDDALLVSDPAWQALATGAGWPAERVRVATWPRLHALPVKAGPLVILADVSPLDPPKDIVEMSSHRLLWEAIADELVRDPWALGRSVLDYLQARMNRLAIGPGQLDQRRFIDQLIAPAYARGLAEVLRHSGLPLRAVGSGWNGIESLEALAVGPVSSREQFVGAIEQAAALVHVWPADCFHAIDACGRAVVRPGATRDAFLRDARNALAGRTIAPQPPGPALSAELLTELLAN